MDTLPLHIRGGSIFPLQYEARNTDQSTQNPWIILVALDDDENASGTLFADDGISENTVENGEFFLVSKKIAQTFGFSICECWLIEQADFNFVGGADSAILSTSINNTFSGVDSQWLVQTIEVVGIKSSQIRSVTINGSDAPHTFSNGRLTIDGLIEPLGGGIEMVIET